MGNKGVAAISESTILESGFDGSAALYASMLRCLSVKNVKCVIAHSDWRVWQS